MFIYKYNIKIENVTKYYLVVTIDIISVNKKIHHYVLQLCHLIHFSSTTFRKYEAWGTRCKFCSLNRTQRVTALQAVSSSLCHCDAIYYLYGLNVHSNSGLLQASQEVVYIYTIYLYYVFNKVIYITGNR